MRRITIVLSDEEYAELERRAETHRRSVRDMAAYLVARPLPPVSVLPAPTWAPYTITTVGNTDTASAPHLTTWKGTTGRG